MYILDHDPDEFLLAITGGICLAHGETEGRTYRNHREAFESQHIDYVVAMVATIGISNERLSADVGCPRSDVPIPSCAQTSHTADRGFSRIVHDLNAIGR
jgi:hypothetical protein